MRWFEYKMEVDDLHASDDLKAKLLAMQSQQAVSVPAAKTVTRKQPEVPAHKKALHFPSSRVWKGLAACAAFCVVAGGAASVLHLGVIGVGGAKSSGPATFSSREATGFSMENAVSSYAMASAPAVADDTMNESSAAAGGADTGTAVLTSGELESAGESAHAAESSKIIYTANLTLESKDYDAARAALDAALAEAGGYLESSDEYANSGSRRSLSLTLRVPQENYESFLAAVAATGNVTYKSQQAEDVTTQYMDIEARLDSLKEQRARLQELKASADNLSDLLLKEQRARLQELKASADNLSDLLQIESSLSDVQYQLESYQSQLDWYSRQVECCTVYLSLEEVQTYTPVEEGFGSRIQNALREGWSGFVETVQSAAVFLVGHWPFLVVGAVCGVIFYKVRHPKHKKQK